MDNFNTNPARTRRERWLNKLGLLVASGALAFATLPAQAQVNYFTSFDGCTLSPCSGWAITGGSEIGIAGNYGGFTTCNTSSARSNLWSSSPGPALLTAQVSLGTSNGEPIDFSVAYKTVAYGGDTPNPAGQCNMAAQWSTSAGGPWNTFSTWSNNGLAGCTTVPGTFTPGAGDPVFIRLQASYVTGDFFVLFDDISVVQQAGFNCTGIPAVGNTNGPADICPGVNFNLTQDATGAGLEYQWEFSTDGGTIWQLGPTTPSWTTNQTVETIYRCEVTCTEPGGGTDTSVPLTVAMAPPTSCYCTAGVGPTSPDDTQILSVSLNGSPTAINYTYTNCPTGAVGVQDLTSLVADLDAGGSYTLIADLNSCSATNYGKVFQAWIDFDQSGTFDPSESIGTASTAFGASLLANLPFNVPGTAVAGTTGMRLMLWEGGVLPLNPCAGYSWGSVMDFTINMTNNACDAVPSPGPTLSTLASVCASDNFTLSLTNPPVGSGLSFQWQTSPDGVNWTNAGPDAPQWTTTQPTATYYQCIVTCDGEGSDVSDPLLVTMNAPAVCVCTVGVGPTSTSWSEILGVILLGEGDDIANSTPCPGELGLQDFTSQSATLFLDENYDIEVVMGSCSGTWNNVLKVWVDWNQNGTFEEPAERVGLVNGPASPAPGVFANINFTVPNTALAGPTIIRVMMVETTDEAAVQPCASYSWGSVHDYSLVVVSPVPCDAAPVPGNTLSTKASVCPEEPFTLSVQNPSFDVGISYQWESSPDGVNWSMGPTTSTWATSQTEATFYRCTVTCAGEGSGTSTDLEVTMAPATSCYCEAGATSLSFEKIGRVEFADIDQVSSSTAGYEDFTAVVGNVTANQSYPLTVTIAGGFAGDQVLVWIDLDQNGVFSSGELVYDSGVFQSAPTQATGNITIPYTALAGTTRMRVRLHDSSLGGNATPCGTSTYGQVEDYTLQISLPDCDFPVGTATFSADCELEVYEITVDLTALPGDSDVDIAYTIDGGAPIVFEETASVGTYNIPYSLGDDMEVFLVTDDADCTIMVGQFFFPSCPPPNDDCSSVTPVVLGHGDTFTANGTTIGSTVEFPAYWGSPEILGDVFYAITLTEPCNFVEVNFCGNDPSLPVVVTVFFPGACGDASGPIFNNAASFTLCGDGNPNYFWNGNLPPGDYFYAVVRATDGFTGVPGAQDGQDFTITINNFACPSADCEDAVMAECNQLYLGSTSGLPNTLPVNSCPFPVSPSTGGVNWYIWEAEEDAEVTVSTCNLATFDSRISIYRVTGAPACDNLECLQFNDDGSGCELTSELRFPAIEGETYYIAIHGFGAAEGAYRVFFSCAPPCEPAIGNDICTTAEVLTPVLNDGLTPPATGTNVCGYSDPNVTCDLFGPMQGVWYTFNTGTEPVLTLNLLGPDDGYTASEINFGLYQNCAALGGGGQLLCNTSGFGSYLLPGLAANTEYKLLVWNDGGIGVEGSFGIQLTYPAQYDAAIIEVLTPDGTECGTGVRPEVRLQNLGVQTLTSATITYDVDFGTPVVFNWTGSLATGAQEIVELPTSSVPTGFHVFNVAVSDPNGEVDQIPANDAASTNFENTGEPMVLRLQLDNWGSETTWEIWDGFGLGIIASGGPYADFNPVVINEELCLPDVFGERCYFLILRDAYGDGMCCSQGNGYWEVYNGTGELLLRDRFELENGNPGTPNQTPTLTPLSPAYGFGIGHTFCLPGGPSAIVPERCNVFTNTLNNKLFTGTVPGAAGYQFEFVDPDNGFQRRIARTQNNVRFGDIVSNPLQPGVIYFVRARADVGFPGYFDDQFGAGCEVGLDPQQVPGCTWLIDDVDQPTFSCGVTRQFGGSDRVWAWPVLNAQQYRFRFVNPGEGFTRNILRPSYVCLLNWVTNPLVEGQYNVTVEVQVNNQWSGFCGQSCLLTIVPPPAAEGRSVEAVESAVMMWPNPVRDGRVQLLIDELEGNEQKIVIDMFDMSGKRVFAQEFPNSGPVFNTVLEVGHLAAGNYSVSILVDGKQHSQQLVVQK